MRTIIQIIPCSHKMYALYKQKEGDFTSEIVCLALVEECDPSVIGEPERFVVGMDACGNEISCVDTTTNFMEYADEPMTESKHETTIPPQPA